MVVPNQIFPRFINFHTGSYPLCGLILPRVFLDNPSLSLSDAQFEACWYDGLDYLNQLNL